MSVPGAEKLVDVGRLVDRDAPGSGWPGRSVEDVAVTAGPAGGVPVAVPVLVIEPASTSAWVVV